MKVKVGKRKILVTITAVLILVGGGLITWLTIYKGDDSTQEQQEPEGEYKPSELSVPTDYYAPSIDEIRTSFPSPAEQYPQFLQYAYAKETVEKYEEAFALYEAAAEVAPNEAVTKDVQYRIYVLAQRTDNQEKIARYRDMLGEDYINTKNSSYRSEE